MGFFLYRKKVVHNAFSSSMFNIIINKYNCIFPIDPTMVVGVYYKEGMIARTRSEGSLYR